MGRSCTIRHFGLGGTPPSTHTGHFCPSLLATKGWEILHNKTTGQGVGGCRVRVRVRGRVRFRVWVRVGVRVRVGIRVMARVKGRSRVRVRLVVWSWDIPPTCDPGVAHRLADSGVLPRFRFA